MTITKKLFIESIKELQEQDKQDDLLSEALQKALPESFIVNTTSQIATSQLIKVLKELTDDNHKDSWIDYYIYDLHFGKTYKPGDCKYKNGDNIDLSMPGKLWDFLIKNKKVKQ